MIHFLKQNVDIKIPFYTQEVEMKYSCVHICNQDTEHFYFEIGMYGHQQSQRQSSEVRKEVKIDVCPDTR